VVHESNTARSYFEGLNFLLNEQPDKAIDSFLEVAKVDSQRRSNCTSRWVICFVGG
jgi:lipopolysaccharide biosynthesis regulator YciM